MNTYHEYIMNTYHAYISWIHIMDTYHGYILWIHIMDTYYGYISWIHIMNTLSLIHLIMSCIEFRLIGRQNSFLRIMLDETMTFARGGKTLKFLPFMKRTLVSLIKCQVSVWMPFNYFHIRSVLFCSQEMERYA